MSYLKQILDNHARRQERPPLEADSYSQSRVNAQFTSAMKAFNEGEDFEIFGHYAFKAGTEIELKLDSFGQEVLALLESELGFKPQVHWVLFTERVERGPWGYEYTEVVTKARPVIYFREILASCEDRLIGSKEV